MLLILAGTSPHLATVERRVASWILAVRFSESRGRDWPVLSQNCKRLVKILKRRIFVQYINYQMIL